MMVVVVVAVVVTAVLVPVVGATLVVVVTLVILILWKRKVGERREGERGILEDTDCNQNRRVKISAMSASNLTLGSCDLIADKSAS